MIAIVVVAKLLRRAQRTVDVLALAVSRSCWSIRCRCWPRVLAEFRRRAWLLWCLPRNPDKSWRAVLRGFFGAQAVATIGLLPLGVALFGQASLAGTVANLVAIPWWSFVVVPLALLGTGLEALHAGLGAWSWRLSALDVRSGMADLRARPAVPWRYGGCPNQRWFALPLALIGAFWLLLPRGVPGKPLALLLWLPLLWPGRDLAASGRGGPHRLDVGQGLSVLVRTAHHILLYDMGPAIPDGFDAGQRVGVPALHALGVLRLDMAIVSHGDNDHAGGFPAVARVSAPD